MVAVDWRENAVFQRNILFPSSGLKMVRRRAIPGGLTTQREGMWRWCGPIGNFAMQGTRDERLDQERE
jgi:hypothetical protein